jgi:2-keto-4-pentenoate hydratase
MSPPVEELAARLRKAVAERTAIGSLSAEYPDLDVPTAYQVQAALWRAVSLGAPAPAGWKLGVTSRAKQAQVGVGEPVRGYLNGVDALDIGEPLDTGALIQPRAEPEIAFFLDRTLSRPDTRAADVLAATGGVAVAVEILDSRFQGYRFTMPDVIADNTSAGRYLVGAPVPPAGIDLRLVGVVLEHNGEVVATASGAASLGHPASAVAWLVRSLAAAGMALEAGQVVLSGGLTAAVPVAAGDVVVATIDRLGSLELACT